MKKTSQRPLPPGIPCVSKKCSVPHPYVGITQIRWGRGNHPPLSPLSENSLADRLHVFPVQDHGKNTASRHGAWSGQGALLTGRDAHWNKMKHNKPIVFHVLHQFGTICFKLAKLTNHWRELKQLCCYLYHGDFAKFLTIILAGTTKSDLFFIGQYRTNSV